MLLEHERGRHHHRTQLRQRQRHEPELIVATKDHQHLVTTTDPALSKEVRGLV